MISTGDFLATVPRAIPRFAAHAPNAHQSACIVHPPASPLMIAAGPGTGKTTVLVLRALRLLFCDGLMPEQIVITTFTRKAAQELRTRLLEWGLTLKDFLEHNPPTTPPPNWSTWLDSVDINRFVTGTLDSLCEEVLTRHRDPTDPAPVLVEGFVGNALLAKQGLFPTQAHASIPLRQYLTLFTRDGTPPANFGEVLEVSRTLVDRLIFDQINLGAFSSCSIHGQARQSLVAALHAYRQFMDQGNRMDFARLEELFLERLQANRLGRFTLGIRAILVDEYQDTNPLQESIYFELARRTNASITVVGDDDQSLYRFRGATVELYRDFVSRISNLVSTPSPPQLLYLVNNYRSTPEIVDYFNAFARNDPAFAPARVQPLKPLIVAQLPSHNVPVLGMFRPDASTLATDLTSFLWDIFRGSGRQIGQGSGGPSITRHPSGGDFGDAVLLSHTVNEYAPRWGSSPARERLPLLMRQSLSARGVQAFNPRGRALRDIPVVQQLLGLVLDCIDAPTSAQPDGALFAELSSPPPPQLPRLRSDASMYLREWRAAGRSFAASRPLPHSPHSLSDFVRAWQRRSPQTLEPWPPEWPLLELCFKLLSWFPSLRDDPEGQVYLEAVTRCISQAATYSSYRSMIVRDGPIHGPNSVKAAIVEILSPLAESDVEVDEDIMPSVPRDRLSFMTIHQAKGLEYPLVIVDVSSDYRTNNAKTRFRRFPDVPSSVQVLEDDLAQFGGIGPLRMARSPLARTFDDLVRLYYVAYSRPQSVLMLVGLDNCLQYNTSIRHVGTSWRQDVSWPWVTPIPQVGRRARPPAQANNIPLTLV